MRVVLAAVIALAGVVAAPSAARAQGSLDAFGALPLNQVTSFGDGGLPLDYGGRVSFELVPAVQIVGEFGRIGNVLPEMVALPLSFAPGDVRVSAFYGEGGVRILAAPHAAVSPYVEGSAGVAHLRFGVSGLGSAGDAIARAAFNLVDTRDPIVGGGGGVLLRSGPIHVDLGYRYKRILADSLLSTIVGAGQGLQPHQVRFGFGVRF